VIIASLVLAVMPVRMEGAQFTFITNNEAITITSYRGTNTDVRIPDTINGLPVTTIGQFAFNSNLRLFSVTIPDSVTIIEDSAFQDCFGLVNVKIGNRVASIGADAFWNTPLHKVKIPASVTNIGGAAFDGCSRLIGFKVDPENPNYSSVNGVLFDKTQTSLVKYPDGRNGRYTIPPKITDIAADAFAYSKITSITIPDSITSIAVNAFYGCSQLKTVIIPNSVINIGYDSFASCSSLRSVTIPGSVLNIGNGAFAACSRMTNASLAEGISDIGSYAFANCRLKDITIPASVTNIGLEAFGSSPSLTSVYFKGDAPILGGYVFDGATDVTLYYLPDTTGWSSFDAEGHPLKEWNP
jgi:hypothetical protein